MHLHVARDTMLNALRELELKIGALLTESFLLCCEPTAEKEVVCTCKPADSSLCTTPEHHLNLEDGAFLLRICIFTSLLQFFEAIGCSGQGSCF